MTAEGPREHEGPAEHQGLRSRTVLAVLGALAYVPLLLTAPGQVSADTKTYLYLDPASLMGRATSMWDPNTALGFVPHQNIGYLWPMGPWFWTLDTIGVPDWMAQRLWWGTLLFAAGTGVVALLRRLGWRNEAVGAAALVYMLTPYVLTLVARLSGILMPWAALPWLVLLTMLSVRSRGWRHPALFALIAGTAGAMNLTALVLAGLGPLLWLLYEVVIARAVRLRDTLLVAGRLGVLTTLVSSWWLVGLVVQAGYGNDVLRYSETAETVAATSTANEALRGLGYWFFYGEDRLGPWIEPSVDYTQSLWLLAATYLLPMLGLLAAGIARWRHRIYFVALVTVGLLVAVGPYPWDDPPPLGQALKALLLTERGLAMRSLPRAAPLLVLGLATLLAAGVMSLLRRSPSRGRAVAGAVAVLALVAQPTILSGGAVPMNLRRPEEVPGYWRDAAARIDEGGQATRAVEIPGSDFASYRWGNTVDPITPGLVERDLAYRELIPFGPPESAELLDAYDLPMQNGVMTAAALAPIARLLRAGDLILRSDLGFERFNTPRPKNLFALVAAAPGLGTPEEFGPSAPNEPALDTQLADELWLLTDAKLPDPPEVAVFPVKDPVAMLAAHPTVSPIVVAGDAYSLVDLAAAGLIDGDELIRFSADLDDREVERALGDDAVLVITDGNRRRGARWHTVRHTKGYTEPAGLEPLATDHSDTRFPVLDDRGDDGRTVAVHRGGVTANATSYGNPITFEPASRPAAAIDGDPATAWRAAGFSDATGERLELELDRPTTTDRVRLLQPTTGAINRRLTTVRLRFDGGDPVDVALDATSYEAPGQLVTFGARTFRTLSIELMADTAGQPPRYAGLSGVGFAEVDLGDDGRLVLDEWIRTPVDLLDAAGESGAGRPLAVVLTRMREAPTDPVREDEERRLSRLIELPTARDLELSGTARLSARAADAVLDAVLRRGGDTVVTSTGRLTGSRIEVGAAALDGELETAWTSPRGHVTGSGIRVQSPDPVELDHLDLAVVADGRHSIPSQLAVRADDGATILVDVPSIEVGTRPGHVAEVRVPLPAPLSGRDLTFTVTEIDPVTGSSWDSPRPAPLPVAIAELGLAELTVPELPSRFDSGCRTDLLEVDRRPVAVRVEGTTADALAGAPLALAPCATASLELGVGEHAIRTADGAEVGIDVDQLVLRSDSDATDLLVPGSTPAAGPQVRVDHSAADEYDLVVSGEAGGDAWLVLGQSLNDGWSASVEGGADLGAPQLVDGFANGWRVPLDEDGRAVVHLRFGPQRMVRLALLLSALGALLCLLLVWRGRAAPPAVPVLPEAASWASARRFSGSIPSRRVAGTLSVAVGLAGALVLPPLLAVGLGGVAGVVARRPRGRTWLLVGSPLLALAAGAYAVLQEVRHSIPPGFEWPQELARAHNLALLAVLLLGIEAVVDLLWERGGGNITAEGPSS